MSRGLGRIQREVLAYLGNPGMTTPTDRWSSVTELALYAGWLDHDPPDGEESPHRLTNPYLPGLTVTAARRESVRRACHSLEAAGLVYLDWGGAELYATPRTLPT